MKFKLINKINNNYSTVEQILTNRGIPLDDIQHYLNTTEDDIEPYEHFGEDLHIAAQTLVKNIQYNRKALVIVDDDCDGYTASALLINYLHDIFPTWVEEKLSFYMHKEKAHGLADVPTQDVQLLLIPDASSNNYEFHEIWHKWSDIIILDHHEAPYKSPFAITVNNQLSDEVQNKNLSGVGIVYKFCKYLDNLLGESNADQYLDLVAVGNIGDMMDLRSFETKHLIQEGLKELKNPFIKGLSEKNSYSMKGKITPINVAFYIAPFINAITRSGTLEEKNIVFSAMLKHKALKKVPSTKRGHKLGEEERILDQALRIATNVKARQKRMQDKGMLLIEKQIKDESLLDNKVILCLLEQGEIQSSIAGLIANKIMAKYNKPCCILFNKGEEYSGSARGCEKTGIDHFKDICEGTGVVNFAEGHQSAMGLSIPKNNIHSFIYKTNEIFKDIQDESSYYVDYIFTDNQDDMKQIIIDIASMENLWGKGVEEPLIAIEKLTITSDMITLMKGRTLKISLPNKIELIKFFSNEEEYLLLANDTCHKEISIIGTCSLNEWNGNVTPQIKIKDMEITDVFNYSF